jgi:hypothetical protein
MRIDLKLLHLYMCYDFCPVVFVVVDRCSFVCFDFLNTCKVLIGLALYFVFFFIFNFDAFRRLVCSYCRL